MKLPLNKWLTRLGLLHGTAEDGGPPPSAPFILTGGDYNEKGYDIVGCDSRTTYDPGSGVLEDQIFFWRNQPLGANAGGRDAQRHHVLTIRGRIANDNDTANLEIVPEQIWIGKKPVFNSMAGDDSDQPKNARLIARIVDFSNQVKTHLNNARPVRDIAKILAGGSENGDLLSLIAAETPLFRTLSKKGGFEPTLTPFILESAPRKGEKLRFSSCDDEQLRTMLGYRINTVEPDRGHERDRAVSGTAQQSGMSYETGVRFAVDRETGRRVMSLFIAPDAPPDDMAAPEPFEIARLEFSREDNDTAVLERASFMQTPLGEAAGFRDGLNLIGFVQEANRHISNGDYPPYRDMAAKYKLLDRVNAMHTPPPLEKEGGEFLWIPLNGCSLEKKVDVFGDGIGGGNMFMSRGLKADGTVSEVAVVVGFPFATGGPKSDYDGMNTDFTPYFDAIRKGYIILDHDHFDHATIEYYAVKGWLRGITFICDERVKYVVEHRMDTLKVPRDQRPEFLVPTENVSNIPVRDEDGNTRIWVQFCKNGARHSALTATQIVTGCYNDQFYKESYFMPNDVFDLSEHGWKFVKDGPRLLGQEKGVTASKVDKDVDIMLLEPTGAPYGGTAPEPSQVKDTWRECLKVVRDKAVVFVPFSTNHLECQTIAELCAEKDTLRNYTFVGANAELRGACMNKFGVNPYLDLTRADIPPEKIAQPAYDVALKALNEQVASFDGEAGVGEYYRYRRILRKAQKEIAAGNAKPSILYEHFMNGKQDEDRDCLLLDEMRRGWKWERDDRAAALESQGRDPRTDTAAYMLKSLYDHGAVAFRNGGHNAYAMYNAILAEQEDAALQATRTSSTAKEFARNPGRLAIITTGPTGTAEEHYASLSRYARFSSLFDVDAVVRNTGYPLDGKDTVFFVTQPAPPVPGAEDSQEALMQRLVRDRDATVFCAFRNGFKIYNPKDKLPDIMRHFRDIGWDPEWDGKANQIRVHDRPAHIHGHGFFNNLARMIRDVPAKLVEFIHIPNVAALQRGQEAVRIVGKSTSIDVPDDHRALRPVPDEKNGGMKMEVTDNLMQSFWLIRVRRQSGRMWGGIVEMVRAIAMRRDGESRADALDVRTSGDGLYMEKSPLIEFNGLLKPGAGGFSARQSRINPSPADVQPDGTRPLGRIAFSFRHRAA